jgi:hypothetical protein
MPKLGERMAFELTWRQELGVEPVAGQLSEAKMAKNQKAETQSRLGQVDYLMTCVRACLKDGGTGNRMTAAHCMRDAAFILNEQAEVVSNMTPPRKRRSLQ